MKSATPRRPGKQEAEEQKASGYSEAGTRKRASK